MRKSRAGKRYRLRAQERLGPASLHLYLWLRRDNRTENEMGAEGSSRHSPVEYKSHSEYPAALQTAPQRESFVTESAAEKSDRISAKDITEPVAANTSGHFSPRLWLFAFGTEPKVGAHSGNSRPSTDADTRETSSDPARF